MQKLLQGINIFLIGMMGSGKSTVGQVLASRLNYRFFDTDVLIERVTQQTIKEIFDSEGEEKFREFETQTLAEVAACTRSVIATGGGIVLLPKNWSYLHHGLIVWLDVPVELLIQRLAEDNTRPLLDQQDLSLKLQSLLEQRRELYAQADLRIMITENQTPDMIVDQIFAKIPEVVIPQFYPENNN
jgi:shikimate kinase